MTPDELRARREALGLSRYALAKRLGVAESTVSRWERGLRRIERPEMLRLALDALSSSGDDG
jgi:transcriptional regulator with XRE-family HTH domain